MNYIQLSALLIYRFLSISSRKLIRETDTRHNGKRSLIIYYIYIYMLQARERVALYTELSMLNKK